MLIELHMKKPSNDHFSDLLNSKMSMIHTKLTLRYRQLNHVKYTIIPISILASDTSPYQHRLLPSLSASVMLERKITWVALLIFYKDKSNP